MRPTCNALEPQRGQDATRKFTLATIGLLQKGNPLLACTAFFTVSNACEDGLPADVISYSPSNGWTWERGTARRLLNGGCVNRSKWVEDVLPAQAALDLATPDDWRKLAELVFVRKSLKCYGWVLRKAPNDVAVLLLQRTASESNARQLADGILAGYLPHKGVMWCACPAKARSVGKLLRGPASQPAQGPSSISPQTAPLNTSISEPAGASKTRYLSIYHAEYVKGRAQTTRMRLLKPVRGVQIFASTTDPDTEVALVGRMLLIAHRCDSHSHGMRYDERDAVAGEAITIGFINHAPCGQIEPRFWTDRTFSAGLMARLEVEIKAWWKSLPYTRQAELAKSFDDKPSDSWQSPAGRGGAFRRQKPDLEEYASENGLTLVVRGAQYGRLMLNGEKLVFFRGPDWETRMRTWLDGWGRSQEEHRPVKISGTVEVDGRTVEYHWIAPARFAKSPRARFMEGMVTSELGGSRFRNALPTHGKLQIMDPHGGLEVDIHGWWCLKDD